MNLLQIVQRIYLEAGKSGPGPVSLTAPNKDVQRMMGWANDAWTSLQRMTSRRWRWMRATVNGVAPAGVITHTATSLGAADFGAWRPASADYTARCFDAAVPGNVWRLGWVDYDRFVANFVDAAYQPGPPQFWTIGPHDELMIGPGGDKDYTLRADYTTAVQQLLAETDSPNMPEQFHMWVVWRALADAGMQAAAPEVLALASDKAAELWGDIVNSQAEKLRLGTRPLA